MRRLERPIEAMAASMRVLRYSNEEECSYRARTSYACARAWVWASCMDDGSDGALGVTKQVINARLKRWTLALDGLYPDIADWYGLTEGKLRLVYNRMIDVDDICENGFSGRYVAHRPALIRINRETSVVIGAFDMADASSDVCGVSVGSTVTTGLSTLVLSNGEPPSVTPPFWETDLSTVEWCRANDVGEVEYINLASRRWGLRSAEAWHDNPTWYEGMTLARSRFEASGPDTYYLTRRTMRGMTFTRIGWGHAVQLWLHLRAASGNGVEVRARKLDNHHVRLTGVPLPFMPGTYARYVDALTWPVKDVGDWYERVVRSEALPAIRSLFERSYVTIKEN